jgi:flagellar biosynthesis protein FlhG
MIMSDQAEQLRADVMNSCLNRAGHHNRSIPERCRVLAVSSGKGGVGKTSLVLNLGLVLIRMGYRVVVIDADLGLANIDVMINAVPRYNLTDVVSGEKRVREIMIRGPLDLKIVPGGSGLFDLANIDRVKRGIILDQLTDLESEADFILIDTAAGISRNVTSFIGASDDFILITTPEPTALTDAYGMLKVIGEEQLKRTSHVVINSTRNLQQGKHTYNGLNRVVQKYLPSMELNYLGEVRHDSAVSAAIHDFIPFVLSRPRSAASIAVNRIAWRIAANGEAEKNTKKGIAGFISRLRELSCD